MKIIIDRFEGDHAVAELENGDKVTILKVVLPPLADEGDVIRIEIDEEATERRRRRIEGLMDQLWED
ncbi:Protein of unknown function [Tindallia magadiensis]|uniref:DUF3006 domain-containing protein n=1 Tax=Tindallia magadiensis TaxID=69895 RepID=A0A1I3GJX0_9FIRM|nr:DUF3006 domain-containing protein [Tindallia magadiensis]SFI23764.1 Protein of unknown function [Tindallia magadiensis]